MLPPILPSTPPPHLYCTLFCRSTVLTVLHPYVKNAGIQCFKKLLLKGLLKTSKTWQPMGAQATDASSAVNLSILGQQVIGNLCQHLLSAPFVH